ncbi:hypothetical protein HK100_005764 [Physocladia obscura]|uniref:DUF4097 domain-containing protein n=1 Tax=Physocladia obscura TaxID=109957 RepID=A0AAD5SSQ7_9FUNG|nr:hypothetical protein HK100_005764 [Physocladia obscura]
MTRSDSITFIEPIRKFTFESKNGIVAVDLQVTTGATTTTTTTVAHTISKNDGDNDIVVSAGVEKETLAVRVTSATGRNRGWLSAFTGNQPRVQVHVTLPGAPDAATGADPPGLHSVDIASDCGGVKWHGPAAVRDRFRCGVAMGETRIGPLATRVLELTADKGSVVIEDARVAESVALTASMGDVVARLSGFAALKATLSMGALKADLAPAPASRSELINSMGELSVTVAKFLGRFEANVSMGDASVYAPGGIRRTANAGSLSGFVGDENAKDPAFISLKNSMGSVKLEFLD